jgi:hypothetical protein
MKYFFVIIFITLFWSPVIAQDTIFFRNKRAVAVRVKEINPETIKYTLFSDQIKLYNVSRDSVLKIKLIDGTVEFYEITVKPKPEEESELQTKAIKRHINYDSLPLIINSVRVYFTDLLYNKICFGYERMYNKKYSLDVDAFYKFLPYGQRNYYGSDWKGSLYNNSEGGELKVGASRHYYKGRRRFSLGAAISYRQQDLVNVVLDAKQDEHRPDDGVYGLTQTKKGIGLFMKFNFQFKRHRSCFEFFVTPGTYAAFTKNNYHYWKSSYSVPESAAITNQSDIPKLKTWYMKDGFAFLPYINFGLSFAIKQKPGSSHKK